MKVEWIFNSQMHQNCQNQKLVRDPIIPFVWDSNLVTIPMLPNNFLVATRIGLWLHDSNINVFSLLSFIRLMPSFVFGFATCNDFLFFFASINAFSCFWKWSLVLLIVVLYLEVFLFCSIQQAQIDEECRTLLPYLFMIQRNTIEYEKAKESLCV